MHNIGHIREFLDCFKQFQFDTDNHPIVTHVHTRVHTCTQVHTHILGMSDYQLAICRNDDSAVNYL